MAKASTSSSNRRRTQLSPENREAQLIALATDLAEQQLRDGTASSQVITHYLKMGSMRERMEREKMEEELQLLRAKTKAYESADEIKTLYAEALKAMRNYSGNGDPDEY